MANTLRRLMQIAERHLTWWQLIFGTGALTIVGAITAWVSREAPWVTSHGPWGLWVTALAGALLTAVILVLIGVWRYLTIRGDAIRQWSKIADRINPLDREFKGVRINILDLMNPVTKLVSGKRFIDCEIWGPANFVPYSNVHFTSPIMGNCDLVIFVPPTFLYNVVTLSNIHFINCKFFLCTIFADEKTMEVFIENTKQKPSTAVQAQPPELNQGLHG